MHRVRFGTVLGTLAVFVPGHAETANAPWAAGKPAIFPHGFAAAVTGDDWVIVSGGRSSDRRRQPVATVAQRDPRTGAWNDGPVLGEARSEHATIAVKNGAVLVAGGIGGGGMLTSTEVLRRGDERWRDAGTLPSPRRNASLIELVDGRVFLFGGQSSSAEKPCPPEIWDPSANRWSLVTSIPTQPGWCGAGAAVMTDGRMLLTGGHDGLSASTRAGMWNPISGAWTETKQMPLQRQGHTMLRVDGGSIVVAGGDLSMANGMNAAGVFDSNETWRPLWSVTLPFWPTARGAVLLATGNTMLCGYTTCAWRPPLWRTPAVVLNTRDWTISAKPYPGDGTLVPLADGTVLILSGTNPIGSTGSWRPWNRPKIMRGAASLTSLPDGRVLMAGGDNYRAQREKQYPSSEDTAEILDPKTGIWSLSGRMHGPKSAQVAVLLSNGEVMVSGGLDSAKLEPPHHGHNRTGYRPPPLGDAMLSSVDIWSPTRGWRTTGSLSEPRDSHTATLLKDGRVIVTGGTQYTFGPDYVDPSFFTYGPERALSSVEMWSPATGKWTSVAPMTRARYGHTATVVADGRVLVVGGDPGPFAPSQVPVEVWSPSTSRWSAVAQPRWQRVNHSATLLADGRVLVAGGRTSTAPNVPTLDLDSAELWDPRSDTWTDAAPMISGRSGHAAVLLKDGRVLVAGGTTSGPPEIWDPASDQWTATVPITKGIGDPEVMTLLPDGRALLLSATTVYIWAP